MCILIKWTQPAMFTATTLKMAWLSQGKGGIFKPRTYGEKPCVSHPLKNPDFGWGQLFCWVVGGVAGLPPRTLHQLCHPFTWARKTTGDVFPLSHSLHHFRFTSSRTGFNVVWGSRQRAEERVLSTVNHDFLYRAIHARETVGMCVFPLPIWGGHFLLMDL